MTLLVALRQHPLTTLTQMVYWLGWGLLYQLLHANLTNLDSCGRGTLIGYPLVLGLLFSALYSIIILGYCIFKRDKLFYFFVFLIAIGLPMLVLNV